MPGDRAQMPDDDLMLAYAAGDAAAHGHALHGGDIFDRGQARRAFNLHHKADIRVGVLQIFGIRAEAGSPAGGAGDEDARVANCR